MIKKQNQRFLTCPLLKHEANKRGQMKLSFGMIFSIILIVVFIAFAFWGITKFLDYQKRIQIGQFVNNFQTDIDRMYEGSYGSTEETYYLPKAIDYVCFVDFSVSSSGSRAEFYNDFQLFSGGEENNMFFYPREAAQGLESTKIEHINLKEITLQENPYCIPNIDGDVKISILINIGDTSVTIG